MYYQSHGRVPQDASENYRGHSPRIKWDGTTKSKSHKNNPSLKSKSARRAKSTVRRKKGHPSAKESISLPQSGHPDTRDAATDLVDRIEDVLNVNMSKFQQRLDAYETQLNDMWSERATISVHQVNRSADISTTSTALFEHFFSELRNEIQRASSAQVDSSAKLQSQVSKASANMGEKQAQHIEDVIQQIKSESVALIDVVKSEHKGVQMSLSDQYAVVIERIATVKSKILELQAQKVVTMENLKEMESKLQTKLAETLDSKMAPGIDKIRNLVSSKIDTLKDSIEAQISSANESMRNEFKGFETRIADGLQSTLSSQNEIPNQLEKLLDDKFTHLESSLQSAEQNILDHINLEQTIKEIRSETFSFNSHAINVLTMLLQLLRMPHVISTQFVGINVARSNSKKNSKCQSQFKASGEPEATILEGDAEQKLSEFADQCKNTSAAHISEAISCFRFRGIKFSAVAETFAKNKLAVPEVEESKKKEM